MLAVGTRTTGQLPALLPEVLPVVPVSVVGSTYYVAAHTADMIPVFHMTTFLPLVIVMS
jgi:hypothetical protein